MRQPGMVVDVGPGETTAQLLDQLDKVPQRTQLLLRLPRDAKALRELDDFNKLRQVAANRELQLVISSPEKTIVGLARLLGFEVDGKPAGIGSMAASDPVAAAAPMTRPAPPATGGSSTMPVAVPAMPSMSPAPAVSPPPATPLSENDWLFGAGQEAVPDDHVEAAGGMPPRQATPPPDVHIVGGPGVTPALRPPAPDEFDDIDAMNFDDAELERDSAQYRQQIAANVAERTTERASEEEIAALEASLAASAAPAPKVSRATNGSGGMLGGLLSGNRKPARVVPRDAASRSGASAPARTPAAAAMSAASVALPHSLLDDEPHQPQADSAAAIAMPMPIPMPAPRPAALPRVERPGPVVRTRPATARRGAGLWVALALIALLGIMLAAAWGVVTFLPQATVSVIPATQVVLHPVEVPVSTTGTSLSSGGGLAAPALSAAAQLTDTATLQVDPLSAPPLQAARVAAQTFTANLSEEATVPTSGSREQPAGKDKITLALVNPGGGRAVLSAGTEVSSGGVTFLLTQDVAVNGATDTGTSLVYGQGSAEAEAAEVGPHTVGVGAVAGTFGNGVRYRNTTSAEGGYMEKIATVAQVDVDRLRGDLLARLQGKINGAIVDQVPKEMTAILPTLSVPATAWKEELDHAVGDDATDLHMKMSVSGSIAAYNPQDVAQAVKQVVASQGVPNDPVSDPQMDQASIQQGPLEMVGSPAGDQITYRTVTTATVQYNLTPDMQEQIKTLVRGKPVADARAAVLNDPYLGKYLSDITITSGLSGLLNLTQDRVPDDPSRIKVQAPEASQP